jgi:hypothetical protein
MNYEAPRTSASTSTVVVQSFVFQALNSALSLKTERASSEDALTIQENSDAVEAWAEYLRGEARALTPGWRISDLINEP